MSSFLSLTRCIKDIGWIPIGKELGGPEDRDYRFSSMYKVSKSNKKLFIRNCFHWESEVGWASGQGSGISRGSLKIGNFARVSENRVLRSIPSTPGHPRSPVSRFGISIHPRPARRSDRSRCPDPFNPHEESRGLPTS